MKSPKTQASRPTPTFERQPPTSTTRMTLPGTSRKTTLAMEPKNSSKPPQHPKKISSPKKMTPPMTQAGRFNIGARSTSTMEKIKPGGVMEAKMRLEERIRKERREMKSGSPS